MWTTPDGYRLRLPHAGLHRILSRLQPEELRRLTGDALGADPATRVVRSIGQLTPRARRVGALRTPAGERLPIFATPGYRMLVRSRGGPAGEILMVRPKTEREIYGDRDKHAWRRVGSNRYRVRGSHVTIRWSGPYKLGRSGKETNLVNSGRPPIRGGGVYIAALNNKPVYVGETSGFLGRWRDRCRIFDELGLPTLPLTPYEIWLGTIEAKNAPTRYQGKPISGQKAADLVRKDVEHVLVRSLLRRGANLNNRLPRKEILAAPLGVQVYNDTNRPSFLQERIRVASQTVPYEIGSFGD